MKLKILLVSHAFHPSIGGIEAISECLAVGFSKAGHEVIVLTRSGASEEPGDEQLPYGIFRSPSLRTIWNLVSGSDVVFHNNVCMRYAWPLVFLRRPWTVATHTWIRRNNGRRGVIDWLKLRFLRAATLISASDALAADLRVPSTTVANSYDNKLFVEIPETDRVGGSLVFVGRLVHGKGVHILLEALRIMNGDGSFPVLTIIGDGDERAALEEAASEYGLGNSVRFMGTLKGQDLVRELNAHEILVVPSLWNEPFGLVALEGAACGCFVVGTANGGLAEAIGPCGSVVPNGDAASLASEIRRALRAQPALGKEFRILRDRHLELHTPESMVSGYLAVLESTWRPRLNEENPNGSRKKSAR